VSCEEWPILWPCSVDDPLTEQQEQAKAFAQTVLWSLSGRRIGICDYVEGYYPACSGACGMPYKGSDGLWRNGGAASECCRILLSHRPIVSVETVSQEEADLDPALFTWTDSYLKRVGSCWPCGDECEVPPVVVAYRAGVGFPAGTDAAMGELACELIKGWNGDSMCRLPSRAVSVSRQGVTVQMSDPSTFVTSGQLGLPMADLWLRSVNPVHLGRASRVYSPDLARMEHTHSKAP
jgi:hypothetical protein